MDRTKEILALLRTLLALLVVLDAPLVVWLFRHDPTTSPILLVAAWLGAMTLTISIVWVFVLLLKFINRLRDEP